MNNEILNDYGQNINISYSIKLLRNILDSIPGYIGEVFVGCNQEIDRKSFLKNNIISWKTFMSGSTQWRIAINHLNDNFVNKKKGTVFLIKSKTTSNIATVEIPV